MNELPANSNEVAPTGRRVRGRSAIKLGLDVGVMVAAVSIAFVARFERVPAGTYAAQLVLLLASLPLLRFFVNRVFGVHNSSWRLFGLREAMRLAIAVSSVSALLLLARAAMPQLVAGFVPVPVSVVALEGTLTLIGMMAVRVAVRLVDEHG